MPRVAHGSRVTRCLCTSYLVIAATLTLMQLWIRLIFSVTLSIAFNWSKVSNLLLAMLFTGSLRNKPLSIIIQ
ncbi:hypothetical protein ANTRET_LOCUS8346 [Anthophora retusa]